MKAKFTVLLITLLAFAVMAIAADKPTIKQIKAQKSFKLKEIPVTPEKQALPFANDTQKSLQKTNGVRKTAVAEHLQVGTSGNGYGWLMPHARSIGRYAGPEVYSGDPIDYLVVGFRGHGDGNADMAVAEINLEAGLANGTLSVYEGSSAANVGIAPWGSGARYPCVVAQNKPAICFNQYVGDVGSPTDPALSHPYMVSDWTGYGESAGAWTAPNFLMDAGWVNPTVATLPTPENRLWNGPVSIVQDASGIYHYVAVYETWYTDVEKQFYGVDNEDHIMTATSNGPDMTDDGWTLGSDIGNDPVWIDTNLVQIYRKGVDMNSSGFGVIAGAGHLGNSDITKDYYYEHTRITYSITRDFGLTWSAWDTVSLTDMGIPGYIHEEDKWIVWEIDEVTGDTTWYDGPAFVGMNFDQSVMVDENNTIWVSFTSMWGAKTDDGWYPNYRYSGVLLAKKNDGQEWGCARIAYNNGIWAGDDYIEGRSQYYFDNESQISRDDQGNVYCAWLDRRRTEAQISRFQKYSDPDDYPGNEDFKTDIYASHSINGGADWTEQINLTDSPALDEYELNMALTSRNQDASIEGDFGRVWVAYCLADTAAGDPATDALIELANDVWVAEAQGFVAAAIEDENPVVAEKFALRQNYPNPFNPTTRIEVVPVNSGQTTLTVYSVTGEKIQTLFNGHANRGVSFSVDFDGSNIAAGVYFYRLKNGNHTEVKKMALIK